MSAVDNIIETCIDNKGMLDVPQCYGCGAYLHKCDTCGNLDGYKYYEPCSCEYNKDVLCNCNTVETAANDDDDDDDFDNKFIELESVLNFILGESDVLKEFGAYKSVDEYIEDFNNILKKAKEGSELSQEKVDEITEKINVLEKRGLTIFAITYILLKSRVTSFYRVDPDIHEYFKYDNVNRVKLPPIQTLFEEYLKIIHEVEKQVDIKSLVQADVEMSMVGNLLDKGLITLDESVKYMTRFVSDSKTYIRDTVPTGTSLSEVVNSMVSSITDRLNSYKNNGSALNDTSNNTSNLRELPSTEERNDLPTDEQDIKLLSEEDIKNLPNTGLPEVGDNTDIVEQQREDFEMRNIALQGITGAQGGGNETSLGGGSLGGGGLNLLPTGAKVEEDENEEDSN